MARTFARASVMDSRGMPAMALCTHKRQRWAAKRSACCGAAGCRCSLFCGALAAANAVCRALCHFNRQATRVSMRGARDVALGSLVSSTARAMANADPYYLVREEIQDSVTKIQTGYDRWERLPQGSESRATIAHDLVRSLPLPRCAEACTLSVSPCACGAQVNECDSVVWQARVVAVSLA